MTTLEIDTRYNALTDRQMDFCHYLIEKRGYNIKKALELAEILQQDDKFVEPRLKEIVDAHLYVDAYDLIELKKQIRRYRSDEFTDTQRIKIWFRVTQWRQDFGDAMNAESRFGHGELRFVGVFDDDVEFGRYLVNEEDYLESYPLSDIFDFFISDKDKDQDLRDSPDSIRDLIDYEHVAMHALYGWYGGAHVSDYDCAIDPENPKQYVYFEAE